MIAQLPYCGGAPLPGTLLGRFNLDPWLIAALLVLATLQAMWAVSARQRTFAVCGWLVAAAAVLSPLCALSVALFAARVGQHMLLLLIAAPLLALGMPAPRLALSHTRLWGSCALFFAALWFWHMPAPYDATFSSTAVYWSMHVSLSGSAVLLWRELLHAPGALNAEALGAGTVTSIHMGLLGAVLSLATHPLFFWHLTTTQAWGLTPLQDQQLGGVLMWVPGVALFLWAALRSLDRLRTALQGARAS